MRSVCQALNLITMTLGHSTASVLTVQCHAMYCSAMPCIAVPCNVCRAVPFSAVPYHVLQSHAMFAAELCNLGTGSMVSAGIQSIFHKWFTDDLNKGYLERLYFVFALLVLMSLGWFVHVSRGYVYREDRVHHTQAVDIVPEMNDDEETTGLLSQSKQDNDDPQHEPIHDHSM